MIENTLLFAHKLPIQLANKWRENGFQVYSFNHGFSCMEGKQWNLTQQLIGPRHVEIIFIVSRATC